MFLIYRVEGLKATKSLKHKKISLPLSIAWQIPTKGAYAVNVKALFQLAALMNPGAGEDGYANFVTAWAFAESAQKPADSGFACASLAEKVRFAHFSQVTRENLSPLRGDAGRPFRTAAIAGNRE